MRAEIITIGDELLDGSVLDTNAAFLAERLVDLGAEVVRTTSVGDDTHEIVAVLRRAAAEMKMVVVSGGLGPTSDDVTTVAVAEAFNRNRVRNEEVLARIRERCKARGIAVLPSHEKQAWVPEGAMTLPNRVGTAPGYTLEFADCLLFFLPGVPHELRRMFEESVIPIVCAGRYGLGRRERRIVRLFGIPESEVDARLSPLIARFPSVDFHFVADAPEVAIKLTPRGEMKGEGERAVIAAADAVAETLADFVFARNRKPVAQLIQEALQRRGAWLSTAESVTGGRIGDLLTNVAGSSHLFAGGIVAYTARAKHELLGVPERVLIETGTVSEETTTAMAQGVRARLDTDFGLAVTGFAGPEGGGEEKPVGTTFIAVATAEGTTCTHHRFEGSRERIKEVAARTALHLLRRRIEQTPLPVEEV